MSDSASYVFLPWVRRGLAAGITRVDGESSPAGKRAQATIAISFNDGACKAAPVALNLYGPGDITGFDARAVLRTFPGADVFEAETNLFPLIELDQADLPWRYTPARATTSDHLRPWLCLIVLEEQSEIDGSYEPAGPRQPLPAVRIKASTPLPNLDQAWAWAHAQVVGDASVNEATLRDRMDHDPHRVLARLVCPRRLKPRTPYVAFLVPTFQRGVLAGLGQLLSDDATDALALSWTGTTAGSSGLKLPFYYTWRFQTGGDGDFEALVRRLEPRVLPSTVGKRDMDVSAPGAGLPPASSNRLGLEGALETLTAQPSAWPDADRNAWVAKLKQLLDRQSEILLKPGGTPILTPPLYGRWHTAVHTLDLGQDGTPRWFHQLNADPRLRATAALGALVVQDQREALLASAWQQVDRIRALNEELMRAQLAREASVRIHERHLQTAGADAVLTMTAQVHSLVRYADPHAPGKTTSARRELDASPIPAGIFEGQFRRVARRRGPLGRQQGRVDAPPKHNLLGRLNDGDLSPAPAPPSPLPDRAGILGPKDGRRIRRDLEIKPSHTLKPYEPEPKTWNWVPSEVIGNPSDPHDPSDDSFRKAAGRAIDSILLEPAPDVRVRVDLDGLRKKVLDALDPRETIGHATARRLKLDAGMGWKPNDPIEPILAAPEFPQPMYEPLRDLSQDWLLPGLEAVPADTLALLAPNPLFIEAYMVGLNFEMARALLFDEFPTDQRGSYFRQFWDVRGNVGSTTAAELEDIKPIHTWSKDSVIGQNSRKPSSAPSFLVLLVRGELLRRYPGTTVYAVEAKRDAGTGLHTLSSSEKHPLFHGTLKPDVTFFGFDLTQKDARGGEGAGEGWFFVIQEPPTAPRFGLTLDDPAVPHAPTTRASLSWKDFSADLDKLAYLDLATSLPELADPGDARWTNATVRASDLASVTWRQPFRVAVHGSRLILNP